MTKAKEQMKTIKDDLDRVQAQIAALQIEEAVLKRLLARLSGEPEEVSKVVRKRVSSVKPLVMDVVHNAGTEGLTSGAAAALVQERLPEVSRETVGSVLSRLKSDGAFVYIGDRYYEKEFAPQRGWSGLAAVN